MKILILQMMTALGVLKVASCVGVLAQQCSAEVDFGFAVESTTVPGATDCVLAVSSNHILAGTNGGFWLFDREGTQVDFATKDDLFPSSIDPFGDPIAVWDPDSSRYFLLMLSGSPPAFNLAMAVSMSSDPALETEDWHFYEFTDLPGNVDFPNMSVGEDYVYVSWARISAQNPGRAVIASLTKADLIAGEEPTFTVVTLHPSATGEGSGGRVPVAA